MAARAYDVAALSLKGPSAHLNFPDLTSSLPQPVSRTAREIQIAAAAAAAAWKAPPSPARAAASSSICIKNCPAVVYKACSSSVEELAHECAASSSVTPCTPHHEVQVYERFAEGTCHTEAEGAPEKEDEARAGQHRVEEEAQSPATNARVADVMLMTDLMYEDVLSRPWMVAEMAQALLLPLPPIFLAEQQPQEADHGHSFNQPQEADHGHSFNQLWAWE